MPGIRSTINGAVLSKENADANIPAMRQERHNLGWPFRRSLLYPARKIWFRDISITFISSTLFTITSFDGRVQDDTYATSDVSIRKGKPTSSWTVLIFPSDIRFLAISTCSLANVGFAGITRVCLLLAITGVSGMREI